MPEIRFPSLNRMATHVVFLEKMLYSHGAVSLSARVIMMMMKHLYSALSMWIIKCALHGFTGDFTRLFMSDEDAFI